MRITSYGAAGGVTGSCHMVQAGELKLLVDCGLFQGRREDEDRNRAPFPFEASDIDHVLLTHGHLDHCGRLPLLGKAGFEGTILSTPATREIARAILLDSAHLQTEEASRRRRKARRTGKSFHPPLYTVQDALYSLDQFDPRPRYRGPLELSEDVIVTYRDAGHVLGSAFIEICERREGGSATAVFSGDLGNLGQHVVGDPDCLPPCDLVVVESTYGDRNHRTVDESVEELAQVVSIVLEQGGNVVIPTCALERAQDVLFYLGELQREQRIPRCRIFLDSPLAIDITRSYRRYATYLDHEVQQMIEAGEDPFGFDGVEFTRTADESRRINDVQGAIILAGSGMCQGGRVLHHLKHNLWDRKSAVVFVGFQAYGTRGRRLVEGAEAIRIYGEEVAVKASIHTIGGFSAHADQKGILQWLKPCRGGRALLVHGEDQALAELSSTVQTALGIRAHIATLGEPVDV